MTQTSIYVTVDVDGGIIIDQTSIYSKGITCTLQNHGRGTPLGRVWSLEQVRSIPHPRSKIKTIEENEKTRESM